MNSHKITENQAHTLSNRDALAMWWPDFCHLPHFSCSAYSCETGFSPSLRTTKSKERSSVWCLSQFAEHPWTEMTLITAREESLWKQQQQQLFIASSSSRSGLITAVLQTLFNLYGPVPEPSYWLQGHWSRLHGSYSFALWLSITALEWSLPDQSDFPLKHSLRREMSVQLAAF